MLTNEEVRFALSSTFNTKVVLVDLDGVILHGRPADGKRWYATIEQDCGISNKQLQNFFRNEWEQCILGISDLKEVLAPYLSSWGYSGDVEAFLKYWFINDSRMEREVLSRLERLRCGGIPVYLATNQEKYRIKFVWQELKLREQFDGIFASSLLRVKKPAAEFFEMVQPTIATAKEEVLFIDDNNKCVFAAREFGWKSERYQCAREFDRILKTHFDVSMFK